MSKDIHTDVKTNHGLILWSDNNEYRRKSKWSYKRGKLLYQGLSTLSNEELILTDVCLQNNTGVTVFKQK